MALTSCATLGVSQCDPLPELHPLLPDTARGRFMVQELAKVDGLVFRNVGWVNDLSELDGGACLSGEEYAKLMKHLRRQQTKMNSN